MQEAGFHTTTDVTITGLGSLDGWSLCHYNKEPINKMDHIRCDNGNFPLARQVGLRVRFNQGVQLREFEIYGLGENANNSLGVRVYTSQRYRIIVYIIL